MAQDAIGRLDAAIRELEAEMQSDPRFALLTQLRNARDAFKVASEALQPAVSAGSSTQATPHVVLQLRDERRNLSPQRAKAFELCKKALEGHTEPVRTRDLYNMIEANGVSLPGGMNNLSSFLTRHPQTFRGYGRQGWTLRDAGNGAEPSSGANGEGPAPLFNTSGEGGDDNEATTTQH